MQVFIFSQNYIDKSSIKYTDPLTKIKNENGIDIISLSFILKRKIQIKKN